MYHFLSITLKNNLSLVFSFKKALKDILKFVNWWFRFFGVTNTLLEEKQDKIFFVKTIRKFVDSGIVKACDESDLNITEHFLFGCQSFHTDLPPKAWSIWDSEFFQFVRWRLFDKKMQIFLG